MEPLFKKCAILPIPQMIEYTRLLFMHNYTQQRLPLCFKNAWVTNFERRTNVEHNLRNQDALYVPLARIKLTERLPMYTMPTLWNNMYDQSLKNEMNLKNFKKKLKTNILSNLQSHVTCTLYKT